MSKKKSIAAQELSVRHITNVVTVPHLITLDEGQTATGETTGLLSSFTKLPTGVAVNVSGVQVFVSGDTRMTIHLTYMQLQGPEVVGLAREAMK